MKPYEFNGALDSGFPQFRERLKTIASLFACLSYALQCDIYKLWGAYHFPPASSCVVWQTLHWKGQIWRKMFIRNVQVQFCIQGSLSGRSEAGRDWMRVKSRSLQLSGFKENCSLQNAGFLSAAEQMAVGPASGSMWKG